MTVLATPRDTALLSNAEAARTRRRERISAVLRYVVLATVGLIMLYPLFWLVGASFKTNREIFTTIWFLPQDPSQLLNFKAYINGWMTRTEFTFATYFLNSFLIVIPRVVVTLVSCTLVAYSFARFDYPGRKILFSIMIATMLLPPIVLRVPQYLMFKQADLIDTYWPLILPSAFATDTFFTFLIVQFLRGIPRDMEEAAMIDGCNALQLLWYIVVPLLKPALISAALFQFIWTMNDFIGPLIYISTVEKYPVSLALKMSMDFTGDVEWANIIAISIVALLPSVIVFLSAQRYFIEGATSSGIKG
jgi:oligogalacturonide transport system permease protein